MKTQKLNINKYYSEYDVKINSSNIPKKTSKKIEKTIKENLKTMYDAAINKKSFDEIKNKLAPDAFEELETDAIKKLDISLNHKLKDIFDIKKLKFEYIINWNIEITTDNGY